MTRFTPAERSPWISAREFAESDGTGRPRALGRGEMALTTASAPRVIFATLSALVASPLTKRTRLSGDCTASGSRTTPTTSWPRPSASATTRWPTLPVAPDTTSFMLRFLKLECVTGQTGVCDWYGSKMHEPAHWRARLGCFACGRVEFAIRSDGLSLARPA